MHEKQKRIGYPWDVLATKIFFEMRVIVGVRAGCDRDFL